MGKLHAWSLAAFLVAGCSGGGGGQPSVGPPDAATGPSDAGTGPSDAGSSLDAGTPSDGGVPDAGAALTPGSLGVGPWPTQNVTYGAADGIQETPVVGMSTDESQNLWVATQSALYLLKPGSTHFVRFAASAGLHLPGNPTPDCFDWTNNVNAFGLSNKCEHTDANAPGISEITGGGPNEVFVGYWGLTIPNLGIVNDPNDPVLNGVPVEGTKHDPARHSGKIDRVRLVPGDPAQGTADRIEVVRFDILQSDEISFWHNRDVDRMLYDHFIHRHELYVGFNHGVDKLTPDNWAPPDTWFLTSDQKWMADHLHPEVCFHTSCSAHGATQMLGDWRGLALAPNGDLWVGGRWTAGQIRYTNAFDATGTNNWQRTPRLDGKGAFSFAFGVDYTQGACGTGTAPVFCPPQEGDPVNISAATVAPDGRVWFASGTLFDQPGDVPYGIAVFDGVNHFTYFSPSAVGLGESDVRDLVALPDGRLVIAGIRTGLVFWDPKTGKSVQMHAGQGIPSDRIFRLELDTMVSPPVLHVATSGGAASIRVFP